jgi:1,4-alpha-glucan branching enzyme
LAERQEISQNKKAQPKMPAKKAAKKKTAKATISKIKETFQLMAPDAEHVLLAGDFTEWEENAVVMKRLKSGVWKLQVALETSSTIQYRFLVDGRWVDDPECQARIPNGMGGENCVRHVGA